MPRSVFLVTCLNYVFPDKAAGVASMIKFGLDWSSWKEVPADILCSEHGRVNRRGEVGRGTETSQVIQNLCPGQFSAT
jgi:hypothetical protein